jgi:FkbM family methyltransferase
MPFVSYAQNFEDVILWRGLGHVGEGFYVDVGAADPVADSVTYAFHERGWSGINIEPTPAYAERLRAARPRDTTLQVAAGDVPGDIVLYEIEGTGLSTTDPAIAARHDQAGLPSRAISVPVVTLDSVLGPRGDAPIQFLKIDAEGSEAAILRGIDLTRLRPWVILLEAMEPNRPVPTRHLWEDLLLGRGYVFAYFDGLNTFYAAREHADLIERLAVPPNVFDQFVRAAELEARDEASALRDALRRETSRRLALEDEARRLARQLLRAADGEG